MPMCPRRSEPLEQSAVVPSPPLLVAQPQTSSGDGGHEGTELSRALVPVYAAEFDLARSRQDRSRCGRTGRPRRRSRAAFRARASRRAKAPPQPAGRARTINPIAASSGDRRGYPADSRRRAGFAFSGLSASGRTRGGSNPPGAIDIRTRPLAPCQHAKLSRPLLGPRDRGGRPACYEASRGNRPRVDSRLTQLCSWRWLESFTVMGSTFRTHCGLVGESPGGWPLRRRMVPTSGRDETTPFSSNRGGAKD